MPVSLKRIVHILFGLMAGAAFWPVVELLLQNQTSFPSFLLLSIVLGLFFGFICGLFFGSVEGIIRTHKYQVLNGAIIGALLGAIGGAAGFVLGQFLLLAAGDVFLFDRRQFDELALPLSRGAAWGITGIFIGITEGVRARSMRKIVVGAAGGFAGGLAGGILLEFMSRGLEGFDARRLIALMTLSGLIGLFYSFLEVRIAGGKVKILNGKLKGKEYLINQSKLSAGTEKTNDMYLADYRNIDSRHLRFVYKNSNVFVEPANQKAEILLNDEPVSDRIQLKFEDVIRAGSVSMCFLPA